MKLKPVLTASAIYLGLVGLGVLLVPRYFGIGAVPADAPPALIAFLRIFAGPCLGIAVLNWMAQGNIIGGIYSRPVAIGNLAHFTIAGLALLKSIIAGQQPIEVIAGTAAYTAFAVLFALVAFTQPARARAEA